MLVVLGSTAVPVRVAVLVAVACGVDVAMMGDDVAAGEGVGPTEVNSLQK